MLTLLCAVSSTFGQEPPIASFAHAGRGSADAVKLLLSRTLPGGEEVWNDFELEIVRIYIFIHNIYVVALAWAFSIFKFVTPGCNLANVIPVYPTVFRR